MQYQILNDRAILRIYGEDAENFLQSLVTNDISQHNQLVYSYLLSPQGRFLFDFFSFYDGSEFLLDVSADAVDNVLKRMNLYKMRSKVSTEIVEGMNVIYSTAKLDSQISMQDPRYNKLGFRSFTLESHIDGTQNDELYMQDKYNYIIPDGSLDLEQDKSFPQEYGAEELNAISYNKGCYVGQEIISRTKYQGVVRKRLYKLEGEFLKADTSTGDAIYQGTQKIGKICSIYKDIAIAQIRTNLYDKNSTAAITVNELEGRISPAIWYKT